jgi:hypothetical protein
MPDIHEKWSLIPCVRLFSLCFSSSLRSLRPSLLVSSSILSFFLRSYTALTVLLNLSAPSWKFAFASATVWSICSGVHYCVMAHFQPPLTGNERERGNKNQTSKFHVDR